MIQKKVVAFEGISDSIPIAWSIEPQSGRWTSIQLGWLDKSCELFNMNFFSDIEPYHLHSTTNAFNERMVRGLFRLGFEDEWILSQLNYSLTEHERLELRLSFPREFWPQHWGEEFNVPE